MAHTIYFPSALLVLLLCSLASELVGAGEVQQVPLVDYECVHPAYNVHVFSKSPLVIYISNFLTLEERVHLEDVTYVPSVSHHPLLPPLLLAMI